MSAHSIAVANVDNTPGLANPLDTTPEIFDTQYFLEVLLPGIHHMSPVPGGPQVTLSPIHGAARLPSDLAIALHPTTSCIWQSFINEQSSASEEFKSAMFKLSTLGQDVSKMVDCSELIPIPPPPPSISVQIPHGFTTSNITQACRKRGSMTNVVSTRKQDGAAGTLACTFHAKRAQSPLDMLNASHNYTQVCCSDVGLPSDPDIAPVLHSIGKGSISPSNGLIGVNCEPLDMYQVPPCPNTQSLACPIFQASSDGVVGLSCSPIEIIV